MAEAMLLGKPVIATGYSGNVDFMTPENSYLVDYELAPIGEGAEPYPADGRVGRSRPRPRRRADARGLSRIAKAPASAPGSGRPTSGARTRLRSPARGCRSG